MRLRIGMIPFLNLLPIFHMLGTGNGSYELVQGVPSKLNRMLREGEIDVSPSSSIEYLRRRGDYRLIEGHSISSRGAVKSILLVSKNPVRELDTGLVLTTHQSETSVAMIEIVLRKLFEINPTLRKTEAGLDKALEGSDAFLAIGDEALGFWHKAQVVGDCPVEEGCRAVSYCGAMYYEYDMGTLWHRLSGGKPFVYALWIARAALKGEKAAALEALIRDLNRARQEALMSLHDISKNAGDLLSPDEALAYWQGISYGLNGEYMEGLGLFESYLREYGLL